MSGAAQGLLQGVGCRDGFGLGKRGGVTVYLGLLYGADEGFGRTCHGKGADKTVR
jgi:hypothetical protein